MAEIPVILAGPIVRRVTPLSVSVWMALSKTAAVKLSIWNKKILAGVDLSAFDEATDPPLHSATANTVAFGANLHLVVVTISIDPLEALLPGASYSYNISFSGAGISATKSDLKSNGLLIDKAADTASPVAHLALGYIPGLLPTFMLPPLTLEELNLVHGSCRKAHGYGKDSLAALDNIINSAVRDEIPSIRPHQLYFTGDQIYADEVPIGMLYYINKLGTGLLGVTETIRAKDPTTSTVITPDVSLENFGPTRRQRIINDNAKLTTDSLGDDVIAPALDKAVGMNHLMSFGEFCATYLLYWSNACWNYSFDAFGTIPRIIEPLEASDFDTIETLYFDLSVIQLWKTDDQTDMEKALCPYSTEEQNAITSENAEEKNKRFKKQYEFMTDRCRQEMADVKMFLLQIPKVRRLLANVPVYMIFDDHEVADDWNGSRSWREEVYGSPLGLSMVRNGLAAYAIFQDWGNMPTSYEAGMNLDMLNKISELFTGTSGPYPSTTAATQLEHLLGLDLTDESAPPVKWHYSVPCGETMVYVLDTRTRRTFPTKNGFPGLMTNDALDDQLPLNPVGGRMLFIVSPAPVLGLGTMEILIQPVVEVFMKFSADPEAWALNPPALEAFLAKVEKFDKVVFLSGDVHYAISTAVDYWKKDKPLPSRFVQLVSSSLKNEKFLNTQFLTASMVQQVLQSLFYPVQRLGWNSKAGLEITNDDAIPPLPAQRISLRKEPVLLNPKSWPVSTISNRPPDWGWSMTIARDIRPDEDSPEGRPEKIHVEPFEPDVDPAGGGVAEAYTKVLNRHVLIHQNAVSRSVVWKSNIGLVKISKDEHDQLLVTHKLLYWLEKDDPILEPDFYTVHEQTLKRSEEDPVYFIQHE